MSKKKNNDHESAENNKETVESELNKNETTNAEISTEEKAKEESIKEAELKIAHQKLAELENDVRELKDSLLRKAAEFENYKRRTEIELQNIFKYAAEPFIISTLPVYDDLERSLNHINEENNIESLKQGLKLVFEKFTKILDGQGVKKLYPKGEIFDFNFHEALMQQTIEGVEPHTVLEVVEPGFIYKDKVIRHAKVIVSQLPETNAENSDADNKEEK